MMTPFAVSGISSLAQSALATWNRITEPKAAQETPSPVAFQAVLNQAVTAGRGTADIQRQLSALPEVKAALAASGTEAGAPFILAPDGTLSRVLPNGGTQSLSLSAESQAYCRSCAAANPGASISLTL
ncbi:MAG: hypothetical protein PHQ12_01225 [Chthoniobacteraceae bacterium]|nr:hypothetical protein [Chthoniobacteraceae bacterium]